MDLKATALFLLLLAASASAAEVVQEIPVYTGSRKQPRVRVWNMAHQEQDGHLLLNEDGKGEPWAGVLFGAQTQDAPLLTLTPDWIELGYVRFRINGLADAYGSHGPPCRLQMRLMGLGKRYQRLRNRFYEDGKGIDADPATFQEVLVALKYFGPKPGDEVSAIGLQCVSRPTRAFAVSDLSLVRFSAPPETAKKRAEESIAQPWVTWPSYDELPDALKVDRDPPVYRNGQFVTTDGRRTFLISPWGREDQISGLGVGRDGRMVSNYGLYDPKTQGFIYEQPLTGKSMSRLGFNSYANFMHPDPFWAAIGYKGKHSFRAFPDEAFREHVRDMSLPFFVDMVCFPWSLGTPAHDKKGGLPPEALHNGKEHWTPYRIIGKGRDIWLTMWRTYAQRYKDAGAQVIFYEFMNEPAYLATTDDHRAEFVEWLKKRYGSLEKVNTTWKTAYDSWEEIARFKRVDDNPGIFFDYDESLGDRFADLIAEGRKAIEAITPGVPAAIQTMGGYCLQPRDAIYLSKLIPHERAVLTPTGGGRWSRHLNNAAPKDHTIDYGMSGSPISNDLLRAMAGNKMIVDNEMYLGPKQTRADLRNRWWKAVLAGLDGAAWFSWSKRGWAWWKGKENIMREADLFPYSALIPYARRADAIRGTLEFAKEMELVREYVLPKPWGPVPTIGMVYSWSNARWRLWDRQLRDKSGDYHAAMTYLHWNFSMVPSHMATADLLARHKLLVAGGIDHIEPALVHRLTEYVQNGGVLIVGEGTMGLDLYGKPVDAIPLLGVQAKGRIDSALGELRNVGCADFKPLPGPVKATAGASDIAMQNGTKALWTGSTGRPMVTVHSLGKGRVYYIAADLVGYPLAKLLAGIREQETLRPALQLTDATTGELAPNILVSRRSHGDHHALILMNPDEFPKRIRIRLADLKGDWHVSDPLEGHAFRHSAGDARWSSARIAEEGIPYAITGQNRGLLLLTRAPWSKTALQPMGASETKARFETERRLWEQARQKGDAPFSMDPSRAAYVDLRAAANATRDDVVRDAKNRWQGFPSTEPLVRTFGGVPFRIIRWDHNEMKGYVALRSAATPHHPPSVSGIQVGSRTPRLFLLHTSDGGSPGEALGKYILRYADGTAAEIPIVIGDTIAGLGAQVSKPGKLATCLTTAVGSAWHVIEWKNPKPDTAIETLELHASPDAKGTIVLVAVTLER